MADRTRLPISPHLRDKLRARKIGGETYDDVIERLLSDASEPERVSG